MKKIHRAWFVFAGCVLLQAAFMGVMINCATVLLAAVRTNMGFAAGDLSVYYTLRECVFSLSMMVTVPFVFRHKSGPVLAMFGAGAAASFFVMALYNHVWQWYISAAIVGLCTSCLLSCVPVIINNWFKVHQGLLLGITSSASGVAGALFSPVVSAMVNAYGWRIAAILLGAIGLAMSVGAALLIVTTPEKCGLEPVGAGTAEEKKDKAEEKSAKTEKVPMWGFVPALVIIVLLGIVSSFGTHLAVFVEAIGYNLTAAGLCTSVSMIGNVAGKLSLGAIADRFGVYAATIFNIVMVSISFLLFLLFPSNMMLIMVGGFCLGLIYSAVTVLPSRMLMDLYGKDGYTIYLDKTNSVNNLILSGTTLLFPYVFDWTGSFNPALIFCLAALIVSAVLTLRLRVGRARHVAAL